MKTKIKTFSQFIMESIDRNDDDDFEFLNNLGLIDITIHSDPNDDIDPMYLEEIKNQLISWTGPNGLKLISAEVIVKDYDFKLDGTLSDGSNVYLYWSDKYKVYNGLCQIHFIDGTVRKLERPHEDEWWEIESEVDMYETHNLVAMLLDFTVAKLMG